MNAVIGKIQIETSYAGPEFYDLMMFTPKQFELAKMYLAHQTPGMPSLEREGASPAYIPQRVSTLDVPESEKNPEAYAKSYFRKEWKLEDE